MLSVIALFCLIGALILLGALSTIDMKTRLLPNELVAAFGALGLVFHLTTLTQFLTLNDIIMGGAAGFASLYFIRFVANRIYGQDALGLGDVKLMGAGGLWLGPEAIMLAMSLGAFFGLLHGAGYAAFLAHKYKTKPDFAYLQIPAGPGFALGLVVVGFIKFWAFRVVL